MTTLTESVAGPPATGRRSGPSPPAAESVVVAGVALVAFVLALITHAVHLEAIPGLILGTLASLVLFAVCGDALAQALLPRAWSPLRPLIGMALGAATAGLALTALGLARIPLSVSLWLTLAAGILASVAVRRSVRRNGRPAIDRVELGRWVVLLFLLFCVALIPAWRTGADTIYGANPDAHQVAGIAVLFQHVPPTAKDVRLPIDTVPSAWRFRYPIFYGLAGASNLAHSDPIRVFPAMAALLVVIAALGFGALAAFCLRLRSPTAMLAAGAVGLAPVTLYLAWHPYWNQLWGFALLPYAVLFGWRALADRDGRAAILFALVAVALWLAYPLALPYPLFILAGFAVAFWRRPRLPALRRWQAWASVLVGLLVLLPAVAGAGLKLEQGVSQLVSPHSDLWGGDITHFLPVGRFAGTGGGIVPALVVLAVAAAGLWRLPRRIRWALGVPLGALCLLDLRFRLVSSGAYMDFKHLSFVGGFILLLAAGAVGHWLFADRRRFPAPLGLRTARLGAAVLALAWIAAVLVQDRREGFRIPQQAPAAMFQLRDWAARLPARSSVRVDIPPSGVQLWAVYMLARQPVDSGDPVVGTTYAHAPYGERADYSLSYRYYLGPGPKRPYPVPLFAVGPPVFENGVVVLRRIKWPARYASYPHTASRKLVEP